ncbi:uncharacterized protein [Mytilus edulis]|uniref:uncharacterized protein n=1 Tax=Mytilus edulis TaxID=6550 RepID=UPI0039F09B20
MALQTRFQAVNTSVAVNEALKELKNIIPKQDFIQHEATIRSVLEVAADTENELTNIMSPFMDKISIKEVENKISPTIGHDRAEMIKNAFSFETYKMKLVKKSDGQSAVQVHRGGAEYLPEIKLAKIQDVIKSKEIQITSIIIEIFMLVFKCGGITDDFTEYQMRAASQELEAIVRQSTFQRALREFIEEWNRGDAWARAKAIFVFLKSTYALGIFWKIIKILFTQMSTFKNIRALAECAVMIVAAVATEGVALIARLALSIDNAVALVEKMVNMSNFEKEEKNLR